MSTPISQGSKLTGLELHAPRRADMRSEPAGVPSAQTSAPASASEEMLVLDEANLDEANDGDLTDDGSIEAVYARLDEAIKDAIDVGRFSDSEESPADGPQLPPAPQLRPDDRTVAVDFALPTAEVLRRNYADAEVESWRRSLLNPVVMPEPVDTNHRSVPTWLLRYVLMIGGAAAVAYVIAVMPSTQGLRDALPHDGGDKRSQNSC